MSYILEELNHSFWNFVNINHHKDHLLPSTQKDWNSDQLDVVNLVEKSLVGVSEHSIKIDRTGEGPIVHVLLTKLYRGVSFDLIMKINYKNKSTRIMYKPIKDNEGYLKVTSTQRIIFAAKQLVIFNKIKP